MLGAMQPEPPDMEKLSGLASRAARDPPGSRATEVRGSPTKPGGPYWRRTTWCTRLPLRRAMTITAVRVRRPVRRARAPTPRQRRSTGRSAFAASSAVALLSIRWTPVNRMDVDYVGGVDAVLRRAIARSQGERPGCVRASRALGPPPHSGIHVATRTPSRRAKRLTAGRRDRRARTGPQPEGVADRYENPCSGCSPWWLAQDTPPARSTRKARLLAVLSG